jgi:hypothetical protein
MNGSDKYRRTLSRKIDDEILEVLNEHDLLTSFPDEFHPMSKTILNQPFSGSADQAITPNDQTINDDIQNLIVKYDLFLRDHHGVVRRVRRSFIDRMINHFLKRMLGSSFEDGDIDLTHRSIQEYCCKHENDLRIIFDYFYQDIKTVVLNRNRVSSLRKYLFNSIPIPIIRFVFVKYCQNRVAQTVKTQLYSNLVDKNSDTQPLSSSSSSSNQTITLFRKYLLLSLILLTMNWMQTQFFGRSPLLFTVVTVILIAWAKII